MSRPRHHVARIGRKPSASSLQARIMIAIRDGAETSQEIAFALNDDKVSARLISSVCSILFHADKLVHLGQFTYPTCRPSWRYGLSPDGRRELEELLEQATGSAVSA